jgi:hypothetical protein
LSQSVHPLFGRQQPHVEALVVQIGLPVDASYRGAPAVLQSGVAIVGCLKGKR